SGAWAGEPDAERLQPKADAFLFSFMDSGASFLVRGIWSAGCSIAQMTKFHCKKATHAFKVYLYHTKNLSTIASRAHRRQKRITLVFVPTKVRRFLCPCNANPALFLFTVYGPTAHASANLSRLSRMKDLK